MKNTTVSGCRTHLSSEKRHAGSSGSTDEADLTKTVAPQPTTFTSCTGSACDSARRFRSLLRYEGVVKL